MRALLLAFALLACLLAGCGGGDDDELASPEEVEQCLRDEELNVTRAPGGGVAGREDTVTVLLPENNIINVAFYESEDDARKGEEDARVGVEAVDSGGTVKRRADVVWTALRSGADAQLEAVEDCL